MQTQKDLKIKLYEVRGSTGYEFLMDFIIYDGKKTYHAEHVELVFKEVIGALPPKATIHILDQVIPISSVLQALKNELSWHGWLKERDAELIKAKDMHIEDIKALVRDLVSSRENFITKDELKAYLANPTAPR